MTFTESETVELKQIYVDDIRKEIVAMANGLGGIIWLGVDDEGHVVGIDDCDLTVQRISNGIRDSVKPDVTMFLHYEICTADDKTIIKITVQTGTNRPYYLSAKGLRPEGVFVRQGTSTVPASDAAIRRMIMDTDGDRYEDTRSMDQALSFDETAAEFKTRGIEFGPAQMRTLGLIGDDGLYTGLGLLLSDQCPNIIKAATFNGTDPLEFRDRREFGGSILKQLKDAYEYIDMRNSNSASFEGLLRQDRRDYPETALREALLNAIVHRDYSFSASTLISIYADRIEMISVGGLIRGIEMDDILQGLSICRNPKLANVLYRLQLIEAYGTGMAKIRSAYSQSTSGAVFNATANTFKVILPKLNTEKTTPVIFRENDDRAERITQYIYQHNSITRAEIESLFDVGTATAVRIAKDLTERGIITVTGKGKKTKYVIGQ